MFMSAAVKPAPSSTRCYQRRRPEHTLWYRTVQTHFETWLALAAGQGDASPPAYIEHAFRRYLECGRHETTRVLGSPGWAGA